MNRISSRSCASLVCIALLSLGGLAESSAQITVDGVFSWVTNGGTNTFDASGSDKLVVVVAGEHNFNGSAGGQINNVTYDGQDLIKAVDVDPKKIDEDGHGDTAVDIWYLDNPGDFHSAGTVFVSVSGNGNNYVYTVLGLSGTAEGVGATATAPGTSTVDLTTTATGSLVVSTIGMGGAGNTASPLPGVTATSPDGAVTIPGQRAGNNWAGHVVVYTAIATPGLQTFAFDTTNTDVATVAAEFLSADGTAGSGFEITAFDYDAEGDTVTLTWNSNPGEQYAIKYSRDLKGWDSDLDDGIAADAGEKTSKTFSLSAALLTGAERVYFRVERRPAN